MPDSRLGCYYCFRTLDPQDKQDELQTFIKCGQCDTVYHAVCWCQGEKCLRCDGDQAQPVEIAPPAPLQTEAKPQALPIKPSAIVYSIGGIVILVPDVIYRDVLPQLTVWRPQIISLARRWRLSYHLEYISSIIENKLAKYPWLLDSYSKVVNYTHKNFHILIPIVLIILLCCSCQIVAGIVVR